MGAALFVVRVAVAAGLAITRARSSTAFMSGNRTVVQARVGASHSFGIGSASRDVDIDSAAVRFAAGSVRAATEVSICRQATATQIGHSVGSATASMCDPLARAPGARLHAGEFGLGAEYLVLTVVPLEVGTVVIDRVEVRYRSDGHTRTDATGPRIEMSVSAE